MVIGSRVDPGSASPANARPIHATLCHDGNSFNFSAEFNAIPKSARIALGGRRYDIEARPFNTGTVPDREKERQ
jgi:hypothetical protein